MDEQPGACARAGGSGRGAVGYFTLAVLAAGPNPAALVLWDDQNHHTGELVIKHHRGCPPPPATHTCYSHHSPVTHRLKTRRRAWGGVEVALGWH